MDNNAGFKNDLSRFNKSELIEWIARYGSLPAGNEPQMIISDLEFIRIHTEMMNRITWIDAQINDIKREMHKSYEAINV